MSPDLSRAYHHIRILGGIPGMFNTLWVGISHQSHFVSRYVPHNRRIAARVEPAVSQ